MLFWKGDEVEVVWADKQSFIATSYFVETGYYDQAFGLIKFKGKKKDGAIREIYMKSRDIAEIQDQATKLLKTITIVPFKSINGRSSRRSMTKCSHEENAAVVAMTFKMQMQQITERGVPRHLWS